MGEITYDVSCYDCDDRQQERQFLEMIKFCSDLDIQQVAKMLADMKLLVYCESLEWKGLHYLCFKLGQTDFQFDTYYKTFQFWLNGVKALEVPTNYDSAGTMDAIMEFIFHSWRQIDAKV